MTKRSDDALFEALFRQAAIHNFEEKFAAIPMDAKIAHTFSARHEAMMSELFTDDE
jgi:hypothetical protein